MRFFIFPIFLILMQPVKAQQEFSSPAFATAFKKIWDDGQTGFKQESGDKYDAAGNYYYIHRVKTLLPGADSGSIYIPVDVGKPYAFYNMKVATKLQDIQAREKSLVAAVKNAFGSTLYETRKQDTSMGLIYNRTVLYSAPGATVFDKKAIETVTVLVKGKYKLGLAIYGKQPVPAAAPLPDEPMLNNRIQELLIAMMGFFETEKGMEKAKTNITQNLKVKQPCTEKK